jgi:tetratricopeptide (TPR) repeat protein
MPTHYEILGVDYNATRKQIRVAFRTLAKKCHPDYHPDRSDWAHCRMQEILRAYEVLINEQKRAFYDRTIKRLGIYRGRSYRENLRRKKADPVACCKLILLDLVEGRGEEGLALYEKMHSHNPPFSLGNYMKRADRLDCEFLLAEEYERQRKPETAAELYSRLYREDKICNYFKHFREEIVLRMRNLVLHFLSSEGNLPLAIRCFSDVLQECLHRRERAFIYKKFAERFSRGGEPRLARLTFISALLLYPKISGTKKIRAKLDIDRLCVNSLNSGG